MRILIIEDDIETADYLSRGLQESGHATEHAADGKTGLELARTRNFDVLIVDRMLPELDGLSLLNQIRASGNHTPALFLSALSEVDDRVTGLQAGADDYLAKPFAFSELLARIDAIVRRRALQDTETRLQIADLVMDRLQRTVTRAGQVINLQAREFRLLEFLMQHAGQVVTRAMLLEQVWGYHFDPQTNVIDVHISRLRAKLEHGFEAPLLHTIRGAGYCLREPD